MIHEFYFPKIGKLEVEAESRAAAIEMLLPKYDEVPVFERILSDKTVLTMCLTESFGIKYYYVKLSSDSTNIGFEGDSGKVNEGETLGKIADEIEMWLEDNINS